MIIARVSAVVAAVVWFVGLPLVTLAAVPLPSDAEFFWDGVLAALLGLTLMPVFGALRHRSSAEQTAAIRISGLAICALLVLSGGLLALATTGRLGERAPDWVTMLHIIGLIALFTWIGLASFVLRGPSRIDRAVSGLGILASVAFLLPILASLPGFASANLTFLPFLLAGLVLWVAMPAWLIAIVVLLWPNPAAQRSATARPS